MMETTRTSQLADRLTPLSGVARVAIEETGGGCTGLSVRLFNGKYLFATAAFRDATGGWDTDPSLPGPDEEWCVSVNPSEDAFWEGGEPYESLLMPVTDDGLVDLVGREM